MGTGFLQSIRFAAAVAMLLAFLHFLIGLSTWVAPTSPSRGRWVGKRVSNVVDPSPIQPRPTFGQLAEYSRFEMTTLFTAVREQSVWFSLSSLLFLAATRQLNLARRTAEQAD